MKYLQKTWIRVVISLLGGGILSEIIHVSTGDPNRPRSEAGSFIMLITAVVLYIMLTNLSKKTS